MEITLEAIISLLGLFIGGGGGTLDSTKTWRVVVWISGEETQIQLMQPVS